MLTNVGNFSPFPYPTLIWPCRPCLFVRHGHFKWKKWFDSLTLNAGRTTSQQDTTQQHRGSSKKWVPLFCTLLGTFFLLFSSSGSLVVLFVHVDHPTCRKNPSIFTSCQSLCQHKIEKTTKINSLKNNV